LRDMFSMFSMFKDDAKSCDAIVTAKTFHFLEVTVALPSKLRRSEFQHNFTTLIIIGADDGSGRIVGVVIRTPNIAVVVC